MSDGAAALAAFAPDGARGRAVDLRVRDHLARSLESIATAAEGAIACDAPGIRALAAAVRAHPVRPAVMATYADAVLVLEGEDEAAAEALLAALADPALRRPALPRIVTLRDEHLGPGNAGRYRSHTNDDPTVPTLFDPLGDAAFDQARARVEDAAALAARALPALAAEIAAVAPETLLVVPSPSAEYIFHGAANFYLWGAILLNPEAHRSRVKLVEGLAHESGHAVLLGATLGAPMVENPDSERFPSPLRHDPRPMDGIIHAACVLARMAWAMDGLAASGLLSAAEQEEARAARARIGRDFADAARVVRDHARCTPAGAVAFDGAQAYMAEVAVA